MLTTTNLVGFADAGEALPTIAFVADVGRTISASLGTSLAQIVTATVPVGALLFALSGQPTNGTTAKTISDSAGNTWTNLLSANDGTMRIDIWYSVLTTQLVSGSGSVTVAGGNSRHSINLIRSSGAFLSNTIGSAFAVSGTPQDSGPTAAPAPTGALALGIAESSTGTAIPHTPGSGWTQLQDSNTTGGAATTGYQTLATAGSPRFDPAPNVASGAFISGLVALW